VRPRNLIAGALLATAALLAACSTDSAPLNGGGLGSNPGHECVPEPVGVQVSDGFFLLTNTGSSPVTITSVKLSSVHGLAVTRAWLMPMYKPPHGVPSGVGDGPYPPVDSPEWPNRQAVPGAVIKPHQSLNLFFGLARTTASTGRAGGPTVTYTAGRNSYTLQEAWGFVIPATDGHC
jgi:hypothetical protein